jgi:hypothetical protein
MAAALGVGAASADGWKSLSGQPVPALAADTWLNTGEETPTLELLDGKVWWLEFTAAST